MPDPYPTTALPAELEQLKARASALLDRPLPASADDLIALLERHLRDSVGTSEMAAPPTLSLTPQSLDSTIRFVREVVTEAHRSPASALESSCNEAAVAGVVLITAGSAIHPALGVLGFAIGVELLLESCG